MSLRRTQVPVFLCQFFQIYEPRTSRKQMRAIYSAPGDYGLISPDLWSKQYRDEFPRLDIQVAEKRIQQIRAAKEDEVNNLREDEAEGTANK